MQGTGLPGRPLGSSYVNTDFNITDETDMVDVWHLFVYARPSTPTPLTGPIDRHPRAAADRRWVHHDALGPDQRRTFPDTVCVAYSNFDTHGYTVDPYLELEHPEHKGFRVSIPYRCLTPQGLDGVLVTGLGVSAHRDAIPLIRMQADVQNQGYARAAPAAPWPSRPRQPCARSTCGPCRST